MFNRRANKVGPWECRECCDRPMRMHNVRPASDGTNAVGNMGCRGNHDGWESRYDVL